jgi:hypothetical protein
MVWNTRKRLAPQTPGGADKVGIDPQQTVDDRQRDQGQLNLDQRNNRAVPGVE